MKKILFKIWIYILTKVKEHADEKIMLSSEPHVVYYDSFIKNVYVCPNGDSALQLVKAINHFHKLTHQTFINTLYGKASEVFKYKMLKILDLKFTWNCPSDERQKIIQYMADTPIRNLEENKK